MQKHLKKIISGALFFVLSLFFSREYIDFHAQKTDIEKQTQQVEKTLEVFSSQAVSSIIPTEFVMMPNTNYLNTLAERVKKAKKRVYINTYMFTEKRLQEALIIAHKNGVDTRVILEKNVYKTPYINQPAFDNFIQNGIDVSWADIPHTKLDHAKYTIIDDTAYIST